MIIVVGGVKGGVGKTSIATNLATIDVLKGCDVLLLDCDKQASASSWGSARDEAGVARVSVMQKYGGLSLTQELKALRGKYQNIYVDAGGYDSQELRASLLVADLLLIPLRPSAFDTWALPRIIEIAAQSQVYNASLKVVFVINGVHPSPNVKQEEEVRELANDVDGMEIAQSVIHNRLAFSKSAGAGLSVVEMVGKDKDPKAIAEITALYKEIIENG